MTVVGYSVGNPWPHPIAGEGMQALMGPDEGGVQLQLVCAMAGVTRPERQAMRKGRLRIGVLPSPPLVWFVLAGAGLSFDAPYGPGLTGPGRAAALAAAAAAARSWPDRRRGLATVALVDAGTGRTEGLRAVSLTRDWWGGLADALAAAVSVGAELSPADRDAAVRRDLVRWPHTDDMLAACTAVEIAGRL